MSTTILFLNENPLPTKFTRGTISGKELRLRAAQQMVDEVHVVALPGMPVESNDHSVGSLEKKIHIHLTMKWPYYLSAVILFGYGLYYLIKLKPKLIEAESPLFSGVAAVLLGKLFHIPVLVEVRASYQTLIQFRFRFLPLAFKRRIVVGLLQWVYSRATVIVVNSITYQRELKQLGFKSVVINPGIQYPPPSLKSRQSKKIIGYLGRLVSEKGVDYLLHACKLLESDLVLGGWRLEIVGDGPLRNSLEHLAESLFTNSGFTVTFSGYGNNYEALSRFSFLVNPCLARHPLEMVNVESAVMKLPVVCFGNEQIPETVIDGQTGLKSRKQTVAALAEQISKLVRGFDPGWKFDSLVQGFRFENQVKRLASVYTGLLK